MNPAEAPGTCWVEPSTPQRPSTFEPSACRRFIVGPTPASGACETCLTANDVLAERRQTIQDFSKAKPATDHEFRIYKTLYAYDPAPLNAKSEPVRQDSAEWRKERVSIDAAYGKERVPVYLFLPARVRPPYQTVIYSQRPVRSIFLQARTSPTCTTSTSSSERARCRISGL